MNTELLLMETAAGPVCGTIRPPGSKSMTNRAVLLAALARGTSELTGLLDSDDTRLMRDALVRLGVVIDGELSEGTLRVVGCGGPFPARSSELFCGNSGTTLRFLVAALAFSGGRHRLYGVPRMHQRPVGDLVESLQQLGVEIECETPGGCPPVLIVSSGVGQSLQAKEIPVRSEASSQFLSALLMAAPMARAPLTFRVAGPLVSRPYIEMTLRMMSRFGFEVGRPGVDVFTVAPGGYGATRMEIEPDASAASYFLAAAAITGGSVTVGGIGRESLQGDVEFCRLLEQMGCHVQLHSDRICVQGSPEGGRLRGIECDMSRCSDTAQTLAVVALFADGATTIRGIAHNRVKETDRIGNLATELRRLGATVEELDDGLRIVPGPLRAATVNTWDDHRMAMSLALVGLVVDGVRIRNPECVGKTFPDYFQVLDQLVKTGCADSAGDQGD